MLRNCFCFVIVIAHMLDATQLRLLCHGAHVGCHATVFVLSLHTCWMLRNCIATVFVLSLHTCWILRNCVCFVIVHMLDATRLCLFCHCTHAGCYPTVFVLSLRTCWMLRDCVCFVIAHMLDTTQLCLFCQCTHAACYATVFVLSLRHAGCYAIVFVLSLHTCWMLRNRVLKLTGTQCLDQTWDQLKRYIPKELRSRDQTTRRDNHRLEEYVWSFLFRMTRGRTCLKHWVNWPKKPNNARRW